MTDRVVVQQQGGIGCGGLLAVLLTVLFVGLKLTGTGVVATWSWVWVVSPIWIAGLLGAAILLFILLIFAIGALIIWIKD